MNIDVEIYLNNIIKFFKDNPNDLMNLIPKEKEEDFYNKIRETAILNIEKGNDPILSQKQIIEICVILNQKSTKSLMSHFESRFGPFILN